eukprot:2950872-Ditylum_brightwellii.AAC.1
MLPSDGQTQSQAVHSAFSRLLQHEWSYLQRVIDADPTHYTKLDDIIKEELISSLLDVDIADNSLPPLFSLPAILQEHQFNLEDHSKCMDKGRMDRQKSKTDKYESILIE